MLKKDTATVLINKKRRALVFLKALYFISSFVLITYFNINNARMKYVSTHRNVVSAMDLLERRENTFNRYWLGRNIFNGVDI